MGHNSRRKSDRRGRVAHIIGERVRAAKRAAKLEERQARRSAKKEADELLRRSDQGDLFVPADDWAPDPLTTP